MASKSSSGSLLRKPLPQDSPAQERNYGVSDWESHLRSQFDPAQPSQPAHDRPSTAHASLSQNYARHPSDTQSQTNTKLQKHAPPLPNHPAPPVPSKHNVLTPEDWTFQFTDTKASSKLTKPANGQRVRSTSFHGQKSPPLQPPPAPPLYGDLSNRQLSPSPNPRGRSSSAQPPSRGLEPVYANRNISAATAVGDSRPGSSNGSQSPTREGEKRGRLRRSWFHGGRSRSNSQDLRGAHGEGAWTLGQTKADYTTSFLINGEKVPELWNENGNVLIYLHPKGSGLGPSFKVPAFVTDTSVIFNDLIDSESLSPSNPGRPRTRSFTGRDSLSVADAERRQMLTPPTPPPSSGDQSPGESRLYLPTSPDGHVQRGKTQQPDLDRLISIRNLFAFLTGQPLVGTKGQPTLFMALLNISALLVEFGFTNFDGTTFGESVDMSFSFLMDQMAIADVRHSREKTLEALVLGERMRSWELYNEAFAHAVGKYSAIRDLNSPLWEMVSVHTRQRLERGHLDLQNRQHNLNNRLEAFEYPALFSGTANSTSQFKSVKFGTWKRSFNRMRSFVLSYYKTNFGSWPPKARSKKNPFSESGLHRQVLKILYSDLCALYDLMADRESITPRAINQSSDELTDEEEGKQQISALRKIFTEFDTSSPPVLPPIPYDIPKLPSMKSVKDNYYDLPAKEQRRLDHNYQEHEFLLILSKSYDFETLRLKIPFLEEFTEFEQKEAKGKPISEIADQRIGYWLFLYVVIQSLPMLVVDAPGLKFTDGVEYFLCQPPKGQPPWMGDVEGRRRWYEISGGAGYVELSEDTIEFSVEGIYHRSHCWVAAKRWEAGQGGMLSPQLENTLSPLQAPQAVFADMDPRAQSPDRSESPHAPSPQLALRPRGGSPAGRPGYRSSIALGLEPVSMPPDGFPGDPRSSRIFSARDGFPAQRPVSAVMSRSRSSGNIHGLTAGSPMDGADSKVTSPQGGGSTFDDILKDLEKKPKKKKAFFG
ncbi:hypothetical protein BX600DRAFT_170610 [Xylariales sp. PMI_506]|nr:hypothetical protein BX600DRAFT_170610 [Xylariales sp. PMI_506]